MGRLRVAALTAFLSIPQVALSQNTGAVEESQNLPVPGWAQAVVGTFDEPFHPIIGGVASGGGVGAGAGYSSPESDRWFRNAAGLVTVKGYWMVEGEVGRQDEARRSRIGVFGEVRDMNRLEFYGLGPNSLRESRSDFQLRETAVGVRGWFKPLSAVRMGGIASVYVPNLASGHNESVAAVEQTFSNIISVFQDEPTFGRYRGFAEFTFPYRQPSQQVTETYRGTYQVAVEAVRDHSTGRYDFNRWEAEMKQVIPGLRTGQRLTLHGLVAGTQADTEVPFYMLYTLGGNGSLKAFRPDMLGSDGTTATMRSFRNYRFRDRSLLLMQAEYRVPVTNWLHATVFVDAGQVAPRVSDLFGKVRTGTGFSVSYMRKNRALARVDVGFGSGEGIQLFWSFGNLGI